MGAPFWPCLHPARPPMGQPHPGQAAGTVRPRRSLEPGTGAGRRVLPARGEGKAPGSGERNGGGAAPCPAFAFASARTGAASQAPCPGTGCKGGGCKHGVGVSPPRLSCHHREPGGSLLPRRRLRRGAGRARVRPSQPTPSPATCLGASAAAALPPAALRPPCLGFPPPSVVVPLASAGEASSGLAEPAGKPGRAMLASSKDYE